MENNQIQIFSNSEFGEIRTVMINEKEYFYGADVATALEYKRPRKAVTDNCKGVLTEDTILNNGGYPEVLISEGDVYRLIIKAGQQSVSKAVQEKADRFEKWVFDDILPSIRKKGFYQAPMSIDDQIELLSKGHGKLKAEIREVKSELDKFKEELPLLPVEMQEITEAVHKKGVSVMGGKKSPAYHDRSICNSVYRDIYNEIHRNFGCFTYKAIPRKYLSKVLDVVEKYALPVVLSDRISDANNQLSFM